MGSCTITIHYEDDETLTNELATDAAVDIWHYRTKAEAHALWDALLALELEARHKLPPQQVAETPKRKYTMTAHPGRLFTKAAE
jgi:hypothetical protein